MTKRAPAQLASRVGALLMNRRRGMVTARNEVVGRSRGPGAVVDLPDSDVGPLTDVLSRSRYENRVARTTDYLHVSDLISRCVRKIAIVEQHKIQSLPQRLSLMDTLTFAVGDTIHDVMKAKVVSGSPTQVWGNWTCRCGATTTTEPSTQAELAPDRVCTRCLGPLETYTEVPMRDEDLKIVGTPDLILYLRELQAFFISELKSIAHEHWKELTRPKPEHVIQILFYWYLMRKLGYPVADKVSVVYVTKGYTFTGNPYKEFVLDPLVAIARLEPYLDMARELKAARENGGLPARIVCSSDRAPDAKKCSVCSICFGGSNAAPVQVSVASALGATSSQTRRIPIRRR